MPDTANRHFHGLILTLPGTTTTFTPKWSNSLSQILNNTVFDLGGTRLVRGELKAYM